MPYTPDIDDDGGVLPTVLLYGEGRGLGGGLPVLIAVVRRVQPAGRILRGKIMIEYLYL